MGLFTWLFGEPSRDELAMKAAVEKGRAMRDAQARAQFDAMIEAQRNGGGTVAGGVRLTADGQVDLDNFDLSNKDAEILEHFKAKHNGGFEPSVHLSTETVDAKTQQQMVAGHAKLPTGQFDPLGTGKPTTNKHGSIIETAEDIPVGAYKAFQEKAGTAPDSVPKMPTEEDKEFLAALAKIGAKPRDFDLK